MRVLNNGYLSVEVVRVNVYIAAEVANRLDTDRGFALRADNGNVGADAFCDISAEAALTAGKRGSVGIDSVLANESLAQLKCESVLACAVCAPR